MTGTVVLPPQPASPFRPPGDPVAARELAGSLLGAGALLDDRHGWVATDAVGPVGREPGWSGPASEAYAAHVRPTGAALAAGAVALRSAASAADAYADALESLRRRGEELADRHVTLRFAVTSFADEVRCTLAGEVTADVVALLQDEARRLRGEVEVLATDSALLRADTLAAEDAFTAVLRRYAGAEATARALATTGGQDPALHIALARAGTGADGLAQLAPNAAASWWASLTAAERDAALTTLPEVVGALDGVPAGARDEANRLLLDRDITLLQARGETGWLTGPQQDALANALAVRDEIAAIEETEDPVTLEPLTARLYGYDPHAFGGDGRVLLSVGDLAEADTVAFTVPGLTTTVHGSLAGNVDNAVNLYREARFADPRTATAGLVWIGYDAPSDWDSVTVAGESRARDGGALLARDVTGYLASRGEDRPHLTVIGHSYGSTTAARGATDVGYDADDIVLIGSPGAGANADHAEDLGVGADRVWVGSASTDYVTYLGGNGWANLGSLGGLGLGDDPAEDDFGARRIQAELTDRSQAPTVHDHTQYFRPGSESLHNLASIVTGRDDDVVPAEHRTDPWWRTSDEPEEDRTPTERSHAP